MLKNIRYYIFHLFFAVMHFMATFVVVLFVLGTFNILNQNLFHIERPDHIEKVMTAAIFVVSIIVFFKSFKRLSKFIETAFLEKP